MTLAAHFSVRRGTHVTTIDLDAEPGEVIGLIGANGAGKTTTLRALAGLDPISRGSISLAGEVWAAAGHLHRNPDKRRTGFVFQEHLLFPHLSAADNVAFGPRARGESRGASRRIARDWLDQLSVLDLADRRTRQLSGGQAQRVAIARALAGDPGLLLLDEPTASLDAEGAMGLRTLLRRHLTQFDGVSIVVTHTALDAMMLTDRIIVLDHGTVVQSGSPAEVAAHPHTQHTAALVGLNLVQGNATQGVIPFPGSQASLVAAEPIDGPAFAVFAPSAVSLFTDVPSGSPRNVWKGTISSLAPHGDAVRVQVDAAVPLLADITPSALATLNLRSGQPIWAAVKATEVTIFPA